MPVNFEGSGRGLP